ncbi:MAG: hypothetical protein ACE5K0_03165 [Candidatus Methanofastidiosia archaeon]
MISHSAIKKTAEFMLENHPDPVVKFLLYRDIIKLKIDSQEFLRVHRKLLKSKWIKQLAEEQMADGSWGRFHSMNTKLKKKIPTTEFGVYRAINLGLSEKDEILNKTTNYLKKLLTKEVQWPDNKESNDRWQIGENLFISATLSQIKPDDPILNETIARWIEIAERTFESGCYDPKAEWKAHCDITGATTMRNSYLVINNRYSVQILGSRKNLLSKKIEKAYVDWLWNKKDGISYIGIPLFISLKSIKPINIDRWFSSHELMSKYPEWKNLSETSMNELYQLKNKQNLWDFGPNAKSYNMHFSETWRKQKNRTFDHSLKTLLLLTRYIQRHRY